MRRLFMLSKEKNVIALAIGWLFLISILHFFNNHNYNNKESIKIGFLPITCHLLLPVTINNVSNINIDTFKFSSWPDMIESLKGGELDGAFILAPIAIKMIQQGVPLKIVLLGHRNGTGLVIKKNDKIKTVKDLKNKTIAIPIRYSNQNIALRRLLENNNINISSVDIVEMPPPDMPSALSSSSINAYIVGEPYAAWSELNGDGKIMYQMKDFWPGFISSVLVFRKDAMDKKKKKIIEFINLVRSQGYWVEKHRKKAAKICASFFGLPESLIKYVLTTPTDRVSYNNLLPKPDEFDEIGNLMIKYKIADAVPKGKDIIDISWQKIK